MATVFSPDYNAKPLHMSSHGNGWVEDYQHPSALAANDVVYLGIIPAGVRVYSVTGPANLTLGYEPTESLPAAGSFVTGIPVTFDRPVKLVGTASAALPSGVTVIVTGKTVGAP